MATKFAMTRDINGYNGFGLLFSDIAYSATLTASTDTTLTVPTGGSMGGFTGNSKYDRWIAVFNYTPGEEVWVAVNTAAAAPAGASFVLTSSEMNPAAREVKSGDVLHFFTTETPVDVSVIFYSLS